jgi:hypothetical protein
MPREIPLEIIMGALTERLRNGPPDVDHLLISLAQAAGAAVQLSDPAGPAVAAALMTIGDTFATVMGAFAAAVADRIDLVTEDAAGSA